MLIFKAFNSILVFKVGRLLVMLYHCKREKQNIAPCVKVADVICHRLKCEKYLEFVLPQTLFQAFMPYVILTDSVSPNSKYWKALFVQPPPQI